MANVTIYTENNQYTTNEATVSGLNDVILYGTSSGNDIIIDSASNYYYRIGNTGNANPLGTGTSIPSGIYSYSFGICIEGTIIGTPSSESPTTLENPSATTLINKIIEQSGTYNAILLTEINVQYWYRKNGDNSTIKPIIPGVSETGVFNYSVATYNAGSNQWVKGSGVVSKSITNPNYSSMTAILNTASNYNALDLTTLYVNISVNSDTPEANASITGQGQYAFGELCTLTLASFNSAAYTFTGWFINGVNKSSQTTYSFNVTESTTVTAKFSIIHISEYTITTNVSPADGGQVTGGGTYPENENITLSATPSDTYKFSKWIKNGTDASTNSTISFNVTESCTYTAKFNKIEYENGTAHPAHYRIKFIYRNSIVVLDWNPQIYDYSEITN